MIKIWQWKDAPEYLKGYSNHGGDEDWVALVPEKYVGTNWVDLYAFREGCPFGVCDVQEVEFRNGDKLFIGAHA